MRIFVLIIFINFPRSPAGYDRHCGRDIDSAPGTVAGTTSPQSESGRNRGNP